MNNHKNSYEHFLTLSVYLTGFEEVELLGTGLAHAYYQQVIYVVGETISQELWDVTQKITKDAGKDEEKRNTEIRREIMADPKLGPVARNIIQLWYWGSWIELSQDWRSRYGTNPQDVTHFTTSQGYQEGLIWKVMETHPEGAKQPGFGSWSMLPVGVHASKHRNGKEAK